MILSARIRFAVMPRRRPVSSALRGATQGGGEAPFAKLGAAKFADEAAAAPHSPHPPTGNADWSAARGAAASGALRRGAKAVRLKESRSSKCPGTRENIRCARRAARGRRWWIPTLLARQRSVKLRRHSLRRAVGQVSEGCRGSACHAVRNIKAHMRHLPAPPGLYGDAPHPPRRLARPGR